MYPAPSQHRRAPAAPQPYYYHSSVFVDPTRDDISRLLAAFEDAHNAQTSSRPFALFKSIWMQHGWDLIHLKVFDPRGREAFLDVMCRLFLECVLHGRTPLLCLGGLFALYTFHSTPPKDGSSLFNLAHVPIALDDYERLVKFPQSLESPARQYATKVLLDLLSKQIFLILPHSSLSPLNPPALPASVLAIESADPHPVSGRKKVGRPSRREKITRADAMLNSLEDALDRLDDDDDVAGPAPSNEAYLEMKQTVLESVSLEDVDRAEKKTIERMRKLEQRLKSDGTERALLLKAEAAAKNPGGLLNLVEESRDPLFDE
ncbi:hypothetical protein EXIGLDRAFT_673733 [Exidia glandulosa HHB12029]|uniref:Uncharacterized protein n=1 Tax=Exidia glandulosa HHB12029 TaxID=1314781 RepID=A0A165IRI9_EXIGL|nr:hypothetical protein EXIGLDRAFT_673733 [Exidia glandulosa HHB12029]